MSEKKIVFLGGGRRGKLTWTTHHLLQVPQKGLALFVGNERESVVRVDAI